MLWRARKESRSLVGGKDDTRNQVHRTSRRRVLIAMVMTILRGKWVESGKFVTTFRSEC